MIIVEDKLKAIFSYLPKMSYAGGENEFTPVFGYGDQKDLDVFLKEQESKNKPYPLIWLLYPYEEEHSKKSVKVEDLVLILAVDTNAVMLNAERLETTFKRILIPLFDNIHTVLRKANTVNLHQTKKIMKFPNYSGDANTGEQNFTVDRWDALKTTWSISVDDNCLRKIII